MDSSLFEEVADALLGMLPPARGELRMRVRRYGIKLWFGPAEPPREHYEAQVIGKDDVKGAKVLALEIGFHSEHTTARENQAVMARVLDGEREWRKVLGKDAVAGPFLGRAKTWQRVSETWPDPDLSDPELSIEVAARLVEYVTALEPVRAR